MIDDEMTRSVRMHGLLSRSLTAKNHSFVRKMFDNGEWDKFILELYCRRKFGHKLVITNIAVRVCKKIQHDLGILVFPLAHRCTTPYKDAGAWSWFMRELNGFDYGSSWSLRECAKKNVYLVMDRYREVIPENKIEANK